MKPEITIQIVGWNSASVLPNALAVLSRIPTNEVIIRYIDNASQDDSITIVRRLLPNADIIINHTNEGFGSAHNQGLACCTTPYILLHNPDLEIEWSAIQQLLQVLRLQPQVAAVQGMLLRTKETEVAEAIIDSVGIDLTYALNGYERGAGEPNTGQYNVVRSMTAVTGAGGLYRVRALNAVAHQRSSVPEIFDHDFFAYKEDVDLGWRLTRHGWLIRYFPVIEGYHTRAVRREGFMNWGLAPGVIYKRLRSSRTQYSLRNWLWLIIKNATARQLIIHFPGVLTRMAVMIVLSAVYPPLVRAWWQAVRGLPMMLDKRNSPPVELVSSDKRN